ncbi:molybdopterin cofactor-binding domain-containing protein [Streptomyces sp. NPDC058874]|uniref:molybdopterin cofactor-binding domain-containing protein n=2 Tax=Streptomyces TaxID=1883 RepID=UPI00367DCB61
MPESCRALRDVRTNPVRGGSAARCASRPVGRVVRPRQVAGIRPPIPCGSIKRPMCARCSRGRVPAAVGSVRASRYPRTDDTFRVGRRSRGFPPARPIATLRAGNKPEAVRTVVSHAPMETNCAVADVRDDRAEIWSGLTSPVVARQTIAADLGLPLDKVTVHVVQAGGSFGRRLFFDAALEAARVSRACRLPVRLMWTRVDDTRHGRMRPATHHKIRATHLLGEVLSFEHRVAAAETDFRHGLGEIITATAAHLPPGIGNATLAQTLFLTTVKSPYHFGLTTQALTEVQTGIPTASWRSVYSANTRGAEEIMVDELAAATGRDPYRFRRTFLQTDAQRAVLDKVAAEGHWGRAMEPGCAQGIAFHEEYKSRTACLVEIDTRDRRHVRVTRAVIAVDVGLPVNPRGLEAQMAGGLTDAISTTLRAGLHIDKGLPMEGSYSQFHWAQQRDTPRDLRVFVLPATGAEPGGAGELGVPAAVGAIANAWARATGSKPRSFPLDFDVDFTPYPR